MFGRQQTRIEGPSMAEMAHHILKSAEEAADQRWRNEFTTQIKGLAAHLGLQWKEEETIPAHWEKTTKKQPQ